MATVDRNINYTYDNRGNCTQLQKSAIFFGAGDADKKGAYHQGTASPTTNWTYNAFNEQVLMNKLVSIHDTTPMWSQVYQWFDRNGKLLVKADLFKNLTRNGRIALYNRFIAHLNKN